MAAVFGGAERSRELRLEPDLDDVRSCLVSTAWSGRPSLELLREELGRARFDVS